MHVIVENLNVVFVFVDVVVVQLQQIHWHSIVAANQVCVCVVVCGPMGRRAHLASLAVLVAALMAAADVRFRLTKTWRFVDAGPGLLALVALVAALDVAFFAAGVSCLLATVADLLGEVTSFLSAGCFAAPESFFSSSLSSGSSLTSLALFFSLHKEQSLLIYTV